MRKYLGESVCAQYRGNTTVRVFVHIREENSLIQVFLQWRYDLVFTGYFRKGVGSETIVTQLVLWSNVNSHEASDFILVQKTDVF